MRIWLDTSYDKKRVPGDCGDCAPPSAQYVDVFWPPESNVLKTLTLRLSQSLYIQEIGNGCCLVCNTSQNAQIVVLDAQAMSLLRVFREPITLLQIIAPESLENLEEAVLLFYRLGFLYDIHNHSQSFRWEESQTLTAWLHVTNACNLRCHYCYLQKTHENMSDSIGRRSVDAIFRSACKRHIKNVRLKYAGGEASLYMMSVMALHEYAVQQASACGITLDAVILSNGVALSQRTIDYLKTRQITITISFDGLGVYQDSQRPLLGGQGSSKYVQRTIERLLANGVKPALSVTVSQRNLSGLPILMHYILKHDLPFSLNYYRENNFSSSLADLCFVDEQIITSMRYTFDVIEKNLPERSLLSSLLDKADAATNHRRTCGVGQNYMVINQNGGVAKCQMDIRRTVATVDSDDPLHFIQEDRYGVQGLNVEEKEGCRTCAWRYWCAGGCPMLTYRSTGRYDVKSPYCNIYKALFPDVLRLEALRLLRYIPSSDFGIDKVKTIV
jgi:uncharacterized protein